ncbi:MAG: MFS transporter [Actinomycetota bacterium]
MSSPRLFTPEFAILSLATALYNGGFGALNVLLPQYVVDVLGGTETTAGIVMGSMAITALVSRPFLGRMADRSGARRIIVAGALTSTVGLSLMLLGDSLAITIIARLVMGIGNAGVFTGSTLLAVTLAPATRRAEAAAYILVSVHLGIGLGPIAGELMRNSFSYTWAWALVVAMMGSAAACACLLTHRPGDPSAAPAPLVNRAAIGPGMVTLFGVFAFNGLLTFAPLYAREIGLEDTALVFTVASMTIIVMRVAFGRVPDTFGPIRSGAGALAISAAATVVVAFWDQPAGLYVGASLTAIGLSLQSPSFMSIAVRRVPESERGSAMATYTGFFDVANALVGPTVGIIVSGVGYQTAFLFTGAMSLVALAILLLNVGPQERGQTQMVSVELFRVR